MFMSHTDVVPVEEEEKWMFPPFSAQIHDGRIYGRGASDCKGLLAAQVMAMRLIRRNNINLRDSLIPVFRRRRGARRTLRLRLARRQLP